MVRQSFCFRLKTVNALDKQVTNLSMYLRANPGIDLYEVAYTLQVGREHMEERLAFLADNIEELVKRLEEYQLGEKKTILTGNVERHESDPMLSGPAGRDDLRLAIEHRQPDILMESWVKGASIDWDLLYDPVNRPLKTSLPGYPFARKRLLVQREKRAFSSNSENGENGFTRLEYFNPKPAATKQVAHDLNQIKHNVGSILRDTLYLEEAVEWNKPFVDLGMDSIVGVEFVKTLNKTFQVQLEATKLYDYPTLNSLCTYLQSLHSNNPEPDGEVEPPGKIQLESLATQPLRTPSISTVIREETEAATKIDDGGAGAYFHCDCRSKRSVSKCSEYNTIVEQSYQGDGLR